MYQNYTNDNRFVSGFVGPFILGGITGGLVAPYFYRPNNYYPPRPYYNQTVYYPPVYHTYYR